VFCVKCGAQTPDDSQFCRKCGHELRAVSTTATVPPPVAASPPKPKSRAALWIFLILLALILWWAATSRSPGARQLQQIAQVVKQQHTDLFNDPALSITATGYSYFKMDVPPGASSVHLQGTFTATGGSGNDVIAYVLSGADFVNLQNGHPANTYYNSGKLTVGTISVNLPADAGTYYLVFDNRFSLLSRKSVRVNATLAYYP
jgi:zinc-ribbon domain